MSIDGFPRDVAEQLDWYVYRLLDPRNGETFYVGKGRGNRVFDHANGVSMAVDYAETGDLKSQRIKEIKAAGLEVGHVIHRHGIESETVAYEVEAALIDAYPGLTNRVKGAGSIAYGCRHAEEILRAYRAEPLVVRERLILICINQTYGEENFSVYDATCCAWKINPRRAAAYKLVLARYKNLVVGAFRPSEWKAATYEHFPNRPPETFPSRPPQGRPERWGFWGQPAEPEIQALYLNKSVPKRLISQNSIRFCEPEAAAAPPAG